MVSKRASLIVVSILLVSAFYLSLVILPKNAGASIRYVGGTGPGNYTTIYDAVMASNPGDTVYVYSGVYLEWVGISKPMNLIGEGMETTIIDGEGDEVIAVQSDWVNITGFTLRNATFYKEDAILLRYAENCTITNIKVSNSYYGIHLFDSKNNTIANNIAYSNFLDGIFIDMSDDNTVELNTIFGQEYNGIRVGNSDRNTIRKNNASSNGSDGIDLYNSFYNTITGNWVEDNDFGGIRIGGGYNIVDNNTVLNNDGGISITSEQNTIINNSVLSNGHTGIYLIDSNNTVIGNTVSGHLMGIRLQNSINHALRSNDMIDNGFYFSGNQLEHWNTHIIDTTNTVNGKPVHYWKNVTGGTVPSGAGQVILANTSGVVVENQNVSGGSAGILVGFSSINLILNNTASSNTWHGVYLYSSERNRILNNTVENNRYGIQLYDRCDNNSFSDNTISQNEWRGITIGSSSNNTFRNNEMVGNGISIYGYFVENWNTHIIDTSNTINGKPVRYWKNMTGGVVPLDAGQVILANCSDTTVENQNLVDGSGGIIVGFSSNIQILNNTGHSNQGSGIHLYYSSHTTVERNKVISSDGSGISMTLSNNNTIANNELLTNQGSGISLSFLSQYISVIENTISHNVRDGIYLTYATNNSVANNTISHSDNGILFRYFNTDNIIVNNTISNCDDGIHLEQYDTRNSISRNTISDNTNGIYFYRENPGNDIDNNTVSHNVNGTYFGDENNGNSIVNNTIVSNGQFGTYLDGSEFNAIYHNSYVDNGEQAFDNRDNNQWDSGYPLGGNYWSNYSGIDNMSGPNQNLPGSDSIGDTPFVIDADTQDRYPLMSPLTGFLARAPVGVNAHLSGENFENVSVEWSLSPDDDKGFKTVVGYEILRNLTYDSDGLGYQLIASPPNGTDSFVDYSAGEGNPNDYFYRVCAVDRNSNTTCAQTQAGKFTRLLLSGPNLMSIPLIQSNNSIDTVLQTLKWDKAWSYDPWAQAWKWNMKSKQYTRGLRDIDHKQAIWVSVSEDSNLTVAGIVPRLTSINLNAGWNLVSFPSFNGNHTVADLKVATLAEIVEGFDATSPPYYLKVLQDTDIMLAGHGYWIWTPSSAVWTLTNF